MRLLSKRPSSMATRGAPLRLGRQRVERLARDALQRGDRVGAHALVRLRVDRLEVRRCRRPSACRPFFGSDIISVPPPIDEVLHARP